MKVRELIEALEDCDQDAEVLIAEQPTYPFENSVVGIAVREEVLRLSNEEPEELGEGVHGNDVFIVEGQQLRYGSKDIWANVRM